MDHFGIENEGGEIKIHHSSGKNFGGNNVAGNMSLDRELGNSRTGNLTGMKKQVMDLASDISDGRENVQEIYEEVDEHEEHDCEEFEIDDMDGDENTKTHTHGVDEIELDFEKLAKQWSLRDENGQYSPEKAKKMLKSDKKYQFEIDILIFTKEIIKFLLNCCKNLPLIV